jgi:hypothetical protein
MHPLRQVGTFGDIAALLAIRHELLGYWRVQMID